MTEYPMFKRYCNEKGNMCYPKYYVGWLTNGNPNTNWPRRFFRHKFETKANQNLIHSITKINHAIAQNNWQVKALVSYACPVSEYPESAKLTLNQPQFLSNSPSELGIVTSCIFIDDKGNENQYVIKPENFGFGDSKNSKIVYLIDYGLAEPYINFKTKEHKKFHENIGHKGTLNYCSLNSHMGNSLSRRDDLE